MSPTNTRQKLWIVIIALLAVVIVGSYFLLANSGEAVEVLFPDEVMDDSEKYIDKNITVDGYYYHESAVDRGFITSRIIEQGSSLTNYNRLPVDHSRVNLSLEDEVKYRFTGVLIEEGTDFGRSVVLVADKISQV